jgi:sugar/nucleoside kinase (ribokinase family)
MLDNIKKVWPHVDVVFGNEEEFKQLGTNLGFLDSDLGVVAQKLAALEKSNKTHKRACIVTRG